MFSEDDLLPISALQHLLFCERQCALIHVEGLWAENVLTVEGRHLHDKAHGERAGPRGGGLAESRPGVRIVRGLPLQSLRLGLVGFADVVEFHECDDKGNHFANPRPFPVEYKRGRTKRDDCDRVQLCAQALCLEDMLEVEVPAGALFYGQVRRREPVAFNSSLRKETEAAVDRLHDLIRSGQTPLAERQPKCESCSLLHLCMPDGLAATRSAAAYLNRAIRAVKTTDVDGPAEDCT